MNTNGLPSPVTYNRAFETGREVAIVLAGESRWLRDLELLLEDKWSNISVLTDEQTFTNSVLTKTPKLVVVESGLWNGAELRVLESLVPQTTRRILVTSKVIDQLGWKRLAIRLCEQGICCLNLGENAKDAAEELQQVFEGMIASGLLSRSEDLELIRAAFLGFRTLGPVLSMGPSEVFQRLCQEFTLNYEVLEAAKLLSETFGLWKAPIDINSPLFAAYKRVESVVGGSPAEKLLLLQNELDARQKQNLALSEEVWTQILKKLDFGVVGTRRIQSLFKEVSTLLQGNWVRKVDAA